MLFLGFIVRFGLGRRLLRGHRFRLRGRLRFRRGIRFGFGVLRAGEAGLAGALVLERGKGLIPARMALAKELSARLDDEVVAVELAEDPPLGDNLQTGAVNHALHVAADQ